MNGLLFTHIFLLGIWLGCVAWKNDDTRKGAAEAHYWIDLLVELPVLVGVVATGLFLLRDAHLTGLLVAKIALGSAAVLINLVCVVFVMRRRNAAEKGDIAALRRWANRVNWTFPFGVPCGLAAFAIGLHLVGFY